MNAPTYGIAVSIFLFVGILALLETGRRLGARRFAAEGEGATRGLGAVEGAMFGLMGLILAFSFSGALTRFDARRHLVVEEANAIGTAWLRLDLLPAETQPAMRDLFRQYLDSRIETYAGTPEIKKAREIFKRSAALQADIWKLAAASTLQSERTQPAMLLLPALNDMIDITTTRTEAVLVHPPLIIFIMLGILALACSLLAGYEMGCRRQLNMLYSLAFAAVLSVTIYVIIDLEYPRLGFIRMTDSDAVLAQLRESMNP